MIRAGKILAAALAFLSLSLLMPYTAPAQDCLDLEPTIIVKGHGVVTYPPDEGEVVLGVESRAPTAQAATEKNAEAMAEVLAAVKAKLGPDDRVATQSYRVSPRYQWDSKERINRFKGFEAVNRVSVATGDPKGLGAIMDAAVQAGANTISGPFWSLKDPAAARREAQIKAFWDAQAQAQALAQAAGMILGTLIKIKTTETGARPPEVLNMKAAGTRTPMEPGRIKITAQATCTFLLEPQQ